MKSFIVRFKNLILEQPTGIVQLGMLKHSTNDRYSLESNKDKSDV